MTTTGPQGPAGTTETCPIMIPYGRHSLDDDDIAAVLNVLKSDWLTTGPKVEEFERVFAGTAGTQEAVAVSNGTAALHAAAYALDVQPGDEVIVPPMTFAATANCVVYQGGTPVFADVDPETLLLDPEQVASKVSPRTKAIIAVDYAGQPCDYDALQALADHHRLALVDDACHAVGGSYKGRPVGSLAGLNTFSFHPVKHITSGEGGMVTTDDPALAQRMRVFRNHGITTDHRQRAQLGSWAYEMVDLGYNYRLTDVQCALGLSQLNKLAKRVSRRQQIARRYNSAFSEIPGLTPISVRPDASHAYHIYVVRIDGEMCARSRQQAFAELREQGIGVNVHYVPVHLHPFYRERFGTGPGLCPVAEAAYKQILSLPIYPQMTDADVARVIEAVTNTLRSDAR